MIECLDEPKRKPGKRKKSKKEAKADKAENKMNNYGTASSVDRRTGEGGAMGACLGGEHNVKRAVVVLVDLAIAATVGYFSWTKDWSCDVWFLRTVSLSCEPLIQNRSTGTRWPLPCRRW